ncbi:hypothetical protein PR003_g27585 [Phytophthora rubi]|uniref:Reverse transcriptase domain-containing protein n=1 Tax=Phytophthora rubi TaxID=129364 RepID=A0A6A4C0N2_9STRA|nr:hypothetical protein PR003_g27585 [Phytophthora rubi]
MPWVAAWNLVQPGADADHHGTKLHVRSPDDPIRVQRPARIYPVPSFATEAVAAATKQILNEFSEQIGPQVTATEAAQKWDRLKAEIVRRTRACVRERRRTIRNSTKQKLARLIRQQQRLLAEQLGAPATVETITEAIEAITLDDTSGPTRAVRLRRAIAECKQIRADRNQNRIYREATHWTGKTTKAFFRRISNKFSDNLIHRLDQPAANKEDIERVLDWNPREDAEDSAKQAIAADITEQEVRTALRACKRGKASGPDRLGNGWYREFEDYLVPILAVLLNKWSDAGVFPPSFLEADIFCLKKGGQQSNALNCRPLALLNTYYKIFTRILATRVGITLPEEIHPNQNGFVPGRTIHETLDLYDAAQCRVIDDPEQAEATAMLLDFKKAYDSLDREYMLMVLRKKGYPEKFVRAIDGTHAGTRVRFLANGAWSRLIQVTSGIRQGCPLAPMLFILALDPLYRKLDSYLGARGVIIQSDGGRFELRVAGYADDTAAFVRHTKDIPIVMRVLDTFGKASGLQINTGKTMVIALHPRGPQPGMTLPDSLVFQKTKEACRYLGLQVGSSIPSSTSWQMAKQKLKVRLQIASQKVLTADQRSLVAGAIIIPQLLYVARHAWPTTEEVSNMATRIRNYVWHGQFSTEGTGHRAWTDPDIAALPRDQGGLAIPVLRAELYAMAAITVSTWAESGTRQAHIVGDVLFHRGATRSAPKVYITPECGLALARMNHLRRRVA